MMNSELELRILHVNTTDFGGGAEGSAMNLYRSYVQQGFASWLAVGQKTGVDPGVLIIPNEAHRPGWTRFWHALRSRYFSSRPCWQRQFLGALARLAEPMRLAAILRGHEDFDHPGTWHLLDLPAQRPTVLHCHNLHGRFFDLRALPWLSRQLPVILNLRDAWLLSGHCAYSLGCERWKIGCGNCPDLAIYPPIRRDATAFNWRRKQQIYARSELYVTAPSRWLIDKVQESMLQAKQYRVIPNGIDLAIFRPGSRSAARRALGLPGDAKIVLFIAHTRFKDLNYMVEALSHVRSPSKDSTLLFLCLGRDYPNESLGHGQARYLGFVGDQAHVIQYFQAADVYIHASRGEAFGKTIVEAMACGVPVVAAAAHAVPEIVVDGSTGFLSSPSEPESMSRLLETLLFDESRRKAMARAALARARQAYGLQRQAESFLEWYREVLHDWTLTRSKVEDRELRQR